MNLRFAPALVGSAAILIASVPALAAEAPEAAAASGDISTVQANGTPDPIRTGFFAETALGGFLTIGGQNYSNTEAFLALGVGYDIVEDLSIGLQFQLAPSAADCYAATACGTSPGSPPSTFTISSIDVKLSYRIPVAERLFVPIRAFGGIAILSPDPLNGSGTGAKGSSGSGSLIAASFGGASGIEWATPFDHFNLGFELAVREVTQVSALALSVYPTVKYTF